MLLFYSEQLYKVAPVIWFESFLTRVCGSLEDLTFSERSYNASKIVEEDQACVGQLTKSETEKKEGTKYSQKRLICWERTCPGKVLHFCLWVPVSHPTVSERYVDYVVEAHDENSSVVAAFQKLVDKIVTSLEESIQAAKPIPETESVTRLNEC